MPTHRWPIFVLMRRLLLTCKGSKLHQQWSSNTYIHIYALMLVFMNGTESLAVNHFGLLIESVTLW